MTARSTAVKRAAIAACATAGAGFAALAWGLAETRSFTVRHRSLIMGVGASPSSASSLPLMSQPADQQSIPTEYVSPADNRAIFTDIRDECGASSGIHTHIKDVGCATKKLRVLHLSDIHLLPHQRKKISWIRGLAEYSPDLLILTGDSLASPRALPLLLDALQPFTNIPGAFVFGSNDYFYPQPKNPFTYFSGPSSRSHGERKQQAELPWSDMREAFLSYGWIDLNNARGSLVVRGETIDFVGVDDPHLGFDRFPPDNPVAKTIDTTEHTSLRIGLAHAPYIRTLDAMINDGCSLVFSGHTHGGQVCVPGVGALVTNCDLPTKLVAGLYDWPYGVEVLRYDGAAVGPGPWVNVSAGLGTSPFAPVRVACRPEAVILDVIFNRD